MWMSKEQKVKIAAIRKAMDKALVVVVENGSTEAINEVIELIRPWKPDVYNIGYVRTYVGVPYKCVQAHDSTANFDWSPDKTPSLWMQYHGTSIETARAWLAPTGAHDMYKVGEYMIWTDDKIYKCVVDTIYDPTAYAQAWEVQNA